tara:strand:+ start:57 stop:263 length:207 start_codon:yes stop_codon:yes gene_type:complete
MAKVLEKKVEKKVKKVEDPLIERLNKLTLTCNTLTESMTDAWKAIDEIDAGCEALSDKVHRVASRLGI